jgi:hypothetical protein
MRTRSGAVTWIALGLGIGSFVAAAFVVIALLGSPGQPGSAAHAIGSSATGRSAPPEPEPGQTVAAGPVPQGSRQPAIVTPPVAGQPLRLAMPAVGLDADVGAMSVAPGAAVDPPTPGSAYWLSNYSVAGPAATGTVFIAGHTYRGGGYAVFNPFLDIPKSKYTVQVGDRIEVTTTTGTWTYTVKETDLYLKTTIQQQKKLWQNVPGRLVLVTCFQYNGGTSSQQNFVVYAQLDG